MRRFATPNALFSEIGNVLGTSAWHQIDQSMIDSFAALSGDHQWIHQEGSLADRGPFTGPIAHGFLMLSLLFPMLEEVFQVDGVEFILNKGLDRLRFTSPVPAGARIRAKVVLASVRHRPRGYSEVSVNVTVEIEGYPRPAYTADSIILYQSSSVNSR